jgi:hypothetical protein
VSHSNWPGRQSITSLRGQQRHKACIGWRNNAKSSVAEKEPNTSTFGSTLPAHEAIQNGHGHLRGSDCQLIRVSTQASELDQRLQVAGRRHLHQKPQGPTASACPSRCCAPLRHSARDSEVAFRVRNRYGKGRRGSRMELQVGWSTKDSES